MGEASTTGLGLAEQISQKTANFIHSKKHTDLLDIVDVLRSNGVSHYVDLPQIIVCGSQSSGKSSTLESLSGIAFPTAEGLCTRFATELILRRSEKSEVKLLKFHEKEREDKNVTKIIEAARVEMGLTGTGPDAKVFSSDVLRIESTSSTAPNLTLVDFPGLFSTSDKNQSDDDVDVVQDLVVGYMKQKRSIILAVVAADSAFANQPVTKFAEEIDPPGTRTLGLITKPDKIDRGSDTERYYIELAQNENVKLSLGWHVLRNKSHATADDTTKQQREEREAAFFSDSDWKQALKPEQLGVANLRERLRDVLWKQINDSLPAVKYEVQMGLKDCTAKLHQPGKARSTNREKHTYLHKISSRVSTMVKAAVDGVYADPFFVSFPGQQDAFERRLRANIQKTLTDYADKMVLDGHALEIVEDDEKPMRRSFSKFMMRCDYLEVVRELMIECRGRELPGKFNPLVVGDLFSRQCKPWEHITQNLAEQVHEAAAITFNKILSEICDDNTRTRLMKSLIQPSLHKLRKDLKEKLDELLEPHLSIHPITYNDYITEAVQKIQDDRHDRAFDILSLEGCGYTSESPRISSNVSLATLFQTLRLLKDGTRPNVEEYSVSLAADVAAAYYQVSLKKFIDNVSVNAVEACLIQNLPRVQATTCPSDMFSPEVAWELTDEQVELLGSEDDRTVKDRAELLKKEKILGQALSGLDAFTARSGTRG
ncbi:hypothetical protein IFR05_002255 [Cadophora sp. M221]|nr:hypothetical protein IFR05_002255 [Cadophora sp. M221]